MNDPKVVDWIEKNAHRLQMKRAAMEGEKTMFQWAILHEDGHYEWSDWMPGLRKTVRKAMDYDAN